MLRDDEEGAEEERDTIERGEEIEEEKVHVDELEFEAEYTSGEEEDEEEEAESSEEESVEEEEGGAEDEDEDEDCAELTKLHSRRSSRTTLADQ